MYAQRENGVIVAVFTRRQVSVQVEKISDDHADVVAFRSAKQTEIDLQDKRQAAIHAEQELQLRTGTTQEARDYITAKG